MDKNEKERIVDGIVERTDWATLAFLRLAVTDIPTSPLCNPAYLKEFGRGLLMDLLEKHEDCNYIKSGMLVAFRTRHTDDCVEYGLRFEWEGSNSAWVEDGVLSFEDSDEDGE